MKKRSYRTITVSTCAALVLALTVTAWPAAPATPQPAEPQDPWAKYQLILDRNIFSRQRGPIRRPGEDQETGPVVVPNPESHFVLKGVVQENNEFIAFIEDTQGGTVLRLRQDDRVARGAIKALNLDEIEYQLEERTTTIKLGYDLEGNLGPAPAPVVVSRPVLSAPAVPAPSAASTRPAASAPAVTSPPAGQPPVPAGDEAEILRRLMEQRKQQLGQ